MKIIYKTGNVLDATERVIAHGCNARGVMGSGVAKAIRESFPYAYKIYRKEYEKKGLKVGEVIWAAVEPKKERGLWIANAITQADFGGDGKQYVDYGGLDGCFQAIHKGACDMSLGPAVAFPLIGAGLGGGKWSKIAPLIEHWFDQLQPVVYLLDGKIPQD